MPDYLQNGTESLPPNDQFLEQTSVSHNRWMLLRYSGIALAVIGAASEFLHHFGTESIIPSVVAVGGVAIAGWAHHGLEPVHQYMSEQGITHQDLQPKL